MDNTNYVRILIQQCANTALYKIRQATHDSNDQELILADWVPLEQAVRDWFGITHSTTIAWRKNYTMVKRGLTTMEQHTHHCVIVAMMTCTTVVVRVIAWMEWIERHCTYRDAVLDLYT